MTDITNFCRSRRLLFVYNTPPVRYNTTSPYVDTSYNQYDLDMRRKAEILKYNTSTQQGQITKTKRWGQLVNINVRTTSSANLSVICNSDEFIPTLTSACDVPGPIITLKNDPAVPLYNYKRNVDSYSILDLLESTDPYQIDGIIPNLLYVVNTRNYLCILKILDNIEYDNTIFELYVPITIEINYDLSNVAIDGRITTSIDLPTAIVTYAGKDIDPTMEYGVNLFESGTIPTETNHIGTTYLITLPKGNKSILIHHYLLITDIELSTSSGYVYSLYLTYSELIYSKLIYIINPQTNINIKNCSISVYLNHDANPVNMRIDTLPSSFPKNVSLI